jgi:hypothetical protein
VEASILLEEKNRTIQQALSKEYIESLACYIITSFERKIPAENFPPSMPGPQTTQTHYHCKGKLFHRYPPVCQPANCNLGFGSRLCFYVGRGSRTTNSRIFASPEPRVLIADFYNAHREIRMVVLRRVRKGSVARGWVLRLGGMSPTLQEMRKLFLQAILMCG